MDRLVSPSTDPCRTGWTYGVTTQADINLLVAACPVACTDVTPNCAPYQGTVSGGSCGPIYIARPPPPPPVPVANLVSGPGCTDVRVAPYKPGPHRRLTHASESESRPVLASIPAGPHLLRWAWLVVRGLARLRLPHRLELRSHHPGRHQSPRGRLP